MNEEERMTMEEVIDTLEELGCGDVGGMYWLTSYEECY